MCNDNDTNPTNYFCMHTICIQDDDGELVLSNHEAILSFAPLEPFEVGFVETVYTVPESVGSVEVCVNFTRPQIDIFEEFVVVEVYDHPSSDYIPTNARLASKSR